jgi:hypothetical protein
MKITIELYYQTFNNNECQNWKAIFEANKNHSFLKQFRLCMIKTRLWYRKMLKFKSNINFTKLTILINGMDIEEIKYNKYRNTYHLDTILNLNWDKMNMSEITFKINIFFKKLTSALPMSLKQSICNQSWNNNTNVYIPKAQNIIIHSDPWYIKNITYKTQVKYRNQ